MEHHTMRSVDPERQDATAHVRGLGDGDLIHFLKHVRRRLAHADTDQVESWASALAALELEAVRRGIRLRGVREPLPPRIAREHLEAAIGNHDIDALEEALPFLDTAGQWRAYRYALELADPAGQARILDRIRWNLDVRLHGIDAARRRHRKATRALQSLEARRRVQRLKSLLDYTFKHYFGLQEGKRR